MPYKQNPQTGESYWADDPTPGAGTESGYQDPNAGAKPKVPAFSQYDKLPNGGKPAPAPGQGPPLPPQTGPVFPPSPAMPVAFGVNGQHFNPTTAPFGNDMSTPGVLEQMWSNNQNLWFDSPQMDWVDSLLPKFNDPWQGEQKNAELMGTMGNPGAGQQYWNGVGGDFNKMSGAESAISGGYKGGNNSKTAFDLTKGMLPGSFQPGFDAHYDRMKSKVMSDVNSQSAARGAYGSNTALNNTIGAGLDVEAQRAKAATDFMFADSANQREWQGILGQQGRAADLSGLGIFGANKDAAQYGLDKTRLGGDLAFRAEEMAFNKDKALSELAFGLDDQALERLGAGVSTAFGSESAHRGRLGDAFRFADTAQDSREDRIGGLYDDVSDMSGDVMSFFTDNYDALLGGDAQMNDQQIEAMIAQTADERGWNQQQQERMVRDVKMFYDMIKGQKAEMAGGAPGAGG